MTAVRRSDVEERRRFREFVRRHHPDRGGDPEVFRRGLALLRGEGGGGGSGRLLGVVADDDPRLDIPLVVVRRRRHSRVALDRLRRRLRARIRRLRARGIRQQRTRLNKGD